MSKRVDVNGNKPYTTLCKKMITKKPVTIVKIPILDIFDRAVLIILISMGCMLTILFGAWWFSPQHISHNFLGKYHLLDIVLFMLLSYVVWHQIINQLFLWYVSLGIKKTRHIKPEKGLKVAFLTAFVPGKEPYDMLENTLRAMVENEYPHDTWLLDEGDDDVAKSICKKLGVKHFTRKGIEEFNRKSGQFTAKTKAGNYNAWYFMYSYYYEFVAQLDVDFVPKKNFLDRTLGYFRDPRVGFVDTPQIYGNQKESWIARGAAEQAFHFYGITQRGLFDHDMVLFIGANHVIRVAAHKSIEGYSGHIVEDHLTGMRLYSKGWKSVYVPEILAIGEGPATWGAYFSQQMRWAFGLIHILFTQSPSLFPKMRLRHAANYLLLQQYYFDGLAQGIGVFLLILYFFFGFESTVMNISDLIVFYLPVIIIQQIITLLHQKYYIDPPTESGFLLIGKFLNLAAWPVYLLALFSVLVGRRLAYAVTPKGTSQDKEAPFVLFIPHFILGMSTAVGIVIAFITGHRAPQLLFFALINTVSMLFFASTPLRRYISQLSLTSATQVSTPPPPLAESV